MELELETTSREKPQPPTAEQLADPEFLKSVDWDAMICDSCQ